MPHPESVELTPDHILIIWDDGHETRFDHRFLRGSCRCASCVNEMSGTRVVGVEDVPADVQAIDWMTVGRYALQFLWSDAHDTGIYPFTLLLNLEADN